MSFKYGGGYFLQVGFQLADPITCWVQEGAARWLAVHKLSLPAVLLIFNPKVKNNTLLFINVYPSLRPPLYSVPKLPPSLHPLILGAKKKNYEKWLLSTQENL